MVTWISIFLFRNMWYFSLKHFLKYLYNVYVYLFVCILNQNVTLGELSIFFTWEKEGATVG